METGSVQNHRGREKGLIVYPVYSRRSRGLSIGINLFPGNKVCDYNCPYCEVFPFFANAKFELVQMENELREVIANSIKQKIPIKDICFSGNGEPTLSPDFTSALLKVYEIRDSLVPETPIVLITNGSGLLKDNIFNLLANNAAAKSQQKDKNLVIWLKVDAATEAWFNKINRPLGEKFLSLLDRIRQFAKNSSFIVQTMICKIEGMLPPQEEEKAWFDFVTEISGQGNIMAVQIYGKARSSPHDPLAEATLPAILEKRATMLIKALEKTGYEIPVDIFP